MKQRTWVKWAAIGFFAVMALLTFFSGTIRNLTLPQITTQPVTPGTITPVVAGSGMTEAGASTEILSTRAGTVTELLVQPGDRVKSGGALIKVYYPDDGALAAKQTELAQQEKALEEAQISASMSSDSGAWAEYQILKNNLDEAQQRKARCQEYVGKRNSLDSQLSAAKAELQQAEAAYHTGVDAAAQEADAAHQALDAAMSRQQNAQANESYYSIDPESEAYLAAKAALEEANAAVLECQNRCYTADTALQSLQAQYQPPVDAARQKAEGLNTQISALEMEYAGCTDEKDCENAVLSAQSSLSSYYDRQKNAQAQGELTAARLAELEAQIEKTEQEIAALEAKLGEAEIQADRDGIVERLYEKESFEAGTVMAVIQSSDAYTLRCPVPIADAALLRIGAEARITNQSAGGISVILAEIQPDETDPANQKSLVFTVTGDNAAANQYFSIAVALESTKHDLVVPNAAVYRDSRGDFLYAVETKTTPLGSRSKVKRVDVELLRRDDRYTAVSGELSREDFVVVLSSAPLEDGQAVRFGD
jgi:multidrug efflux pump subunit AcrA (membrane-fusion protein)